MTPEKKENLAQVKKMAKRHKMWETAKKHLPEGVVAGAGLTLGLSLVFWYLKRGAGKKVQSDIDKIEKMALSEIEARRPQLGSELAALAVIEEEVGPDFEELAKKENGRKLVRVLKKICSLSGVIPGGRHVEDLVLGASIKALEGVESLLESDKAQKTPTTKFEPQDN